MRTRRSALRSAAVFGTVGFGRRQGRFLTCMKGLIYLKKSRFGIRISLKNRLLPTFIGLLNRGAGSLSSLTELDEKRRGYPAINRRAILGCPCGTADGGRLRPVSSGLRYEENSRKVGFGRFRSVYSSGEFGSFQTGNRSAELTQRRKGAETQREIGMVRKNSQRFRNIRSKMPVNSPLFGIIRFARRGGVTATSSPCGRSRGQQKHCVGHLRMATCSVPCRAEWRSSGLGAAVGPDGCILSK